MVNVFVCDLTGQVTELFYRSLQFETFIHILLFRDAAIMVIQSSPLPSRVLLVFRPLSLLVQAVSRMILIFPGTKVF